jgi:uncharacterized protein (TIGR02246 family)
MIKNILFATAAAAGLALAACAPQAEVDAPTPVVTPQPPSEAEVQAVVSKLDAALATKDAAAVAALYAPEAVLVASDKNASVQGVTAEALAPFMALEPKAMVNARTFQVLDADTFISSGIVTYDIVKSGKASWVAERYTHVYEKQADGEWMIAHAHNSKLPELLSARLPAMAGETPATTAESEAPPLGGSSPVGQ